MPKEILHHKTDSYIYIISRLLERAAYYGIRAILILYMIGESLKMERAEALAFYGLLTSCLMISRIIGALLGDLWLQNKKAVIIGGFLQAAGAFILCLNSITSLYIGAAILVIGCGLFSPNLLAYFGKLYLDRKKLLNSGFSLLYVAINIGAFIGVMLIPIIGETYGWQYGFALAGLVFIAATLFPLLSDETLPFSTFTNKKIAFNTNAIVVVITLVIAGLFWGFYELSGYESMRSIMQFVENESIDKDYTFWNTIGSYFIVPIGVLLFIIWNNYHYNQLINLIIGFFTGAVALGLLFFIPDIPSLSDTYIFIAYAFLFSISELFVSTTTNALLTEYTNPKYLAIIMSLAYIPVAACNALIGLFSETFYNDSLLALKIAAFGLLGITSFLILFYKISKGTIIKDY